MSKSNPMNRARPTNLSTGMVWAGFLATVLARKDAARGMTFSRHVGCYRFLKRRPTSLMDIMKDDGARRPPRSDVSIVFDAPQGLDRVRFCGSHLRSLASQTARPSAEDYWVCRKLGCAP